MILQRIVDLLRGLRREQAGSIAVATAVAAPMVLGCAGIAIDSLLMVNLRGHLQAAADSAVLASVKGMDLAGSTDGQVKAVARAYVSANLAAKLPPSAAGEGSRTVDVEVLKSEGAVEVVVAQSWTPFFLHFLSGEVTPVRVKARAETVGRRLACVIGLSPIVPSGVQLWSRASLTADGCDVYSNTALPTGLIVKDNATLKANLICVSGGYIALSPKDVEPKPITDCPPFEDPLAARQAPKVGGCDHLATVIVNKKKTLNPGVYCGGLIILGKSVVTLNPGVYIINNGLFTVGGSATLKGENVGFYLAGLLTVMLFDSGSTIDLTAPKDGPLAGILFFEDRKAPPLRVHRIGSNNARNLLGTIYLPAGILFIDSNAPVADNSDYTAIVVRSLQLGQGPKLVLHSDYENSDVPVPDGLIVGSAVLTN